MTTKARAKKAAAAPVEQAAEQPPTQDVILLASQQIAEKAEQELDRLHKDELATLHLIEQTGATITKLEQEQADRARHLADIRGIAANLSREFREAEGYAKLAQGTIGEGHTVREYLAVKEKHDNHAAHVAQVEQKYAALDEGATGQLQMLRSTKADLHSHLEGVYMDQRTVEIGRARALQELGESTLAALLAEYEQYHAQVEECKSALSAAQLAEAEYLEQVLPRLASWPNLQYQLSVKRTYRPDSTGRVIRGALDYIDLLLAESKGLADTLSLPTASGYYMWWQMLTVESADLWQYENLKGQPHRLHEKRERLRQLLTEYQRMMQARAA